jgi:hypothetical protein
MNSIEEQIDNLINITTQNILNNNADNENETYEKNEESEEGDEQESIHNVNNSISNSISNEIQNNSVDETNVEGFNVALHQYLQIDEEIKTLLEAIKSRNQKKKQLALSLGSYLRTNQISTVNLGGSYKGKKLESVVSYSSKGFNKVSVTEALYNELKEEEDLFNKVMEAISNKSVMKEMWKIKITNEKQPKNKSEKEKNKISMAEELLNEEDE